MTTFLLALVIVGAAAAVAVGCTLVAVGLWVPWRRHRPLVRVAVTLVDGGAVVGVQLRRLADGGLLIAAAQLAEQEAGERVRTTALDGDVAIPGRKIRFVQRLGVEPPDRKDE